MRYINSKIKALENKKDGFYYINISSKYKLTVE